MLGGTGDEGFGLALRWAKHGHEIIIGSRSLERAQTAAQNSAKLTGSDSVSGLVNEDAASKADIVVVSVPFGGLVETLRTVKRSLRQGHIVVNLTVPLETTVGGRATRTLGVWAGSAGELVSNLVPKGVRVVSAFNNVSAELLNDLSREVDCDVLVCGNDEDAKKLVFELIRALPGARAVDAGPLENSRTLEQLTALLVSLNIRYGVKSAGIRITGINPVS